MFVLRNYYASKNRIANAFSMVRKMSVKSESALPVDTSENGNDTKDTVRFSEEEIEKMRNKSRLRSPDRNKLNNELPYPEPCAEHHTRVFYMRRMYGLYGDKSGVDPSICWPSPQDIKSTKEYESLARPHTFEEMVKINIETKAAEKESIQKRDEEVAQKMSKLQKWRDELNARIQKREAEAIASKAKKDRLIEEVRRYFGFKVDIRDERFQEMMEKKEKEEKKLAKEAKRKAREAKLMSYLLEPSKKPDVEKPS